MLYTHCVVPARQHRTRSLLLAMAALAVTGAATAAKPSEAQLRYQQERAACMNGSTNQARSTCLKEAAAALAEARRGVLGTSDRDLQRNRMARCQQLPSADRDECQVRMREGTATGTARDGGILRESTRVVPAR